MLTSTSMANIGLRGTWITIFDQANFAGTQTSILVNRKGCTSVPTSLNDRISSISFSSTNELPNCILAFRNPNCDGTRFQFNDGTTCLNDLANADCDADNTISSFKICERRDFVTLRT